MPRKSDVPRRKAALWEALAQGAPELIEDADVAYFKATRPKCEARQFSDETRCERCLLSWDTNDAHPPPCPVINPPRKPKQQPERDEVQRPLVVYLRRHLPAGSVVFAIPNLARSRQQTFSLMRDGMLPGVPDLCVITRDIHGCRFVGFIECKRPHNLSGPKRGGSLSDAQEVVQAQIRALGFPVLAECRSVVQARDWLREQGVEIR